ncbi:hypothetical protein RI367_001842 [Sorochytrium milnesiophthora]
MISSRDVRCFVSRVLCPLTNLAIEEWLFRALPPSSYVLYLWRNSPCVVLGRNQNQWKECNVQALEADGTPYIRRQSGGGTVYHDLGNSIYTVIQPKDGFTRHANAEMISRALNMLDVPASVNHRHDIVLDGKKISGSAFKLTSTRAYHHGTMLINTDLGNLRKYLKVNKPRLITKGVASVPSPVTNLSEYSYTVDHTAFCEAVIDEFKRTYDVATLRPTVLTGNVLTDIPRIQQYRDELASWEWQHGQTPDFEHTIEISDSLHLFVKSKRGRITDAQFTSTSLDSLYSAALSDLEGALIGNWYHGQGIDAAWEKFSSMQGRGFAQQDAQLVMEQVRQVCDGIKQLL